MRTVNVFHNFLIAIHFARIRKTKIIKLVHVKICNLNWKHVIMAALFSVIAASNLPAAIPDWGLGGGAFQFVDIGREHRIHYS